MLTVVITGVGFPGHEGQGRIAAAEPRQPTPRAEHMHLDRLGREAEQPGDFLGLQMARNQAQDLPLTRCEPFETWRVFRCHHSDSMRPASRDVQRRQGAGRHKFTSVA
ncbi:hypothetical protein AQ619_00265 [Caulobacter henricii]|uniref:Uncharacterized protein n=1 Tax=Caulobacter henricii TaxID=69395 RepID=A0A0P0NV86_9CAUL|nr:hypothetical protein AQ619_00265 [Caulobacter henricii]